MATESRIICDPKIMGGKPIVTGTRITVELILEKLAAGDAPHEIIEDYPDLSEESIRAAIKFAADALRSDFIYPTDTAA
jgi:uncharacterized protein (DUF433 family)